MNTRPIVAAPLAFTDDGVPYSPHFDDIYHPRSGAFARARHVFLGGNQLPARWQHQARFVILETGFGLGNNFLATWQAWRDDPARCAQLIFVSIEQRPFSAQDLARLHANTPAPALSAQLIDHWPPLTHNLHTLEFEDGRVRLMLAFGDVEAWLPELVAQVDAFYLDGFAPARNPQMWQPRIYKALARLAAPHATAATWTSAVGVREGLQAAGFEATLAQGAGGKRDITLARYAPRFTPKSSRRRAASPTHRRALIIGAGLAGCATARALAAEGWHSTLLDRLTAPAQAASGNPAGLFHGIVNAQDGVHARLHRAAALWAQHTISACVRGGRVPGAVQGLLRLAEPPAHALQAVLDRLGLPDTYVQAFDAAQASQYAGLPLHQSAWFYPGGGWVSPHRLAHAWLEDAGPQTHFRGGCEVARLHRTEDGWQALDAHGQVIDTASTVIVTNAHDAARLLARGDWPLSPVRGQLSQFTHTLAPTLTLPLIPVAGAGYLLPEVTGQVVFGATSQADDTDPSLRLEDHAHNQAQLEALLGTRVRVETAQFNGRVGWRATTRDRLPLLGAVPVSGPLEGRLDQPRWVPRIEGLYVFAGLGSRGITWAALGAQAVASWVTGSPAPVEASLLDALDPARFISREARRQDAAASSN